MALLLVAGASEASVIELSRKQIRLKIVYFGELPASVDATLSGLGEHLGAAKVDGGFRYSPLVLSPIPGYSVVADCVSFARMPGRDFVLADAVVVVAEPGAREAVLQAYRRGLEQARRAEIDTVIQLEGAGEAGGALAELGPVHVVGKDPLSTQLDALRQAIRFALAPIAAAEKVKRRDAGTDR